MSVLGRTWILGAVMVIGFIFCVSADAIDFGRDDSGNVKFTVTSLPFLNDDKEQEDSCESNTASDYDDAEYTTDSIGRRVPVRTHRSGSAITTR
jgi:hypothetical protein